MKFYDNMLLRDLFHIISETDLHWISAPIETIAICSFRPCAYKTCLLKRQTKVNNMRFRMCDSKLMTDR